MTAFLWTMLVMLSLALIAGLRTKVGQQDKPATLESLLIAAVLRTALIAWILVLLTGCGGGGDDPDVMTPRVNCAIEVCR